MAQTSGGAKPKVEAINTGLQNKDTKVIAEALGNALADTFTLYLKTLGVHWNVVGPQFYSIHKLTEAQYEDLAAAVDVLAERIRALGHLTPAAFGDYTRRSVVDSKSTIETPDKMLEALIMDNEAIALRLREAVKAADDAEDVFTADMLTTRIGQHEENGWMLRSMNA